MVKFSAPRNDSHQRGERDVVCAEKTRKPLGVTWHRSRAGFRAGKWVRVFSWSKRFSFELVVNSEIPDFPNYATAFFTPYIQYIHSSSTVDIYTEHIQKPNTAPRKERRAFDPPRHARKFSGEASKFFSQKAPQKQKPHPRGGTAFTILRAWSPLTSQAGRLESPWRSVSLFATWAIGDEAGRSQGRPLVMSRTWGRSETGSSASFGYFGPQGRFSPGQLRTRVNFSPESSAPSRQKNPRQCRTPKPPSTMALREPPRRQ